MSFLKSFRNSVSRKSSKSNSSVVTISGSGGSFSRAASPVKRIGFEEELPAEGILRSNTFTVKNEESILVKVKHPSKTTSMFGKFGITRKKKPKGDELVTNTYKSWSNPKAPTTQPSNDPFGVLYSNTISTPTKVETLKKSSNESGTYRKNKLPASIREQLDEIKDIPEPADDRDKFKTVTINSFRKSFRDKFLNTKKEAPHNPAWFVEVEPPKQADNESDRDRSRDTFIFENDNYRPTARSPIRDVNRPTPKPRTSIKRNETFRVERESDEPSIRIEIKNSITPHQPGRIVPVGVAKPMPVPGNQLDDRSSIIQRTWMEPNNANGRNSTRNMYQTTIQITDGATYPTPKPRHIDNIPNNFKRSYTPSGQTRIQITGNTQPKDSFISNYTPLTSYGMLKTFNQQSNVPISQRNKSAATYHERSPTFESKKCSQLPTIASKQKAIGLTNSDHSARRDAMNITRIMSHARKPMSKAPWR